MAVAIVTGASRGLGRALALALAERGWDVVADGRHAEALAELAAAHARIHAVAGDVTDPAHRRALVSAAWDLGGASLVVNNAGVLGSGAQGSEPLVTLAEQDLEVLRRALEVNVLAPLGLTQEALSQLLAHEGALLNITSDAAVEAYPTWGAYGATKAALEQWSAVLQREEPSLRVWWVDPGEMNTAMYAAADAQSAAQAPLPEEQAVPALLALVTDRLPSGRYTAAGLAAEATEAGAGVTR
ncbi:SDR family NAD(P)-dependent oxidoreductase [Streptacidiphilus sp. MAP5-3]|uniref:SDR family NAD(P)-dependent oxidoreductase n=1 Tax=unclassified Streptacidiphilus TaxID=2643834 RepID=UPI003515DF8A